MKRLLILTLLALSSFSMKGMEMPEEQESIFEVSSSQEWPELVERSAKRQKPENREATQQEVIKYIDSAILENDEIIEMDATKYKEGFNKDLYDVKKDLFLSRMQGFLKEFFARGISVNARYENGNTLLHYLLEKKFTRKKIIKFLLDEGASINAVNDDNQTPLQVFCAQTNDDFALYPNLLALLLKHGARCNNNEANSAIYHIIDHCTLDNYNNSKLIFKLMLGSQINGIKTERNLWLLEELAGDKNSYFSLLPKALLQELLCPYMYDYEVSKKQAKEMLNDSIWENSFMRIDYPKAAQKMKKIINDARPKETWFEIRRLTKKIERLKEERNRELQEGAEMKEGSHD